MADGASYRPAATVLQYSHNDTASSSHNTVAPVPQNHAPGVRREGEDEREMFMSQVKAIYEENLAKSITKAPSPHTDPYFDRTPMPKSEADRRSDAEILEDVTKLPEIIGKDICPEDDANQDKQELKMPVIDAPVIKSTGAEGDLLIRPSSSHDEGTDEYHCAEEGEHGCTNTEFSRNAKSQPKLMDLAQIIEVSALVEMSTTIFETKQSKGVGDSDEEDELDDKNNKEARVEDGTEAEAELSDEGEKWQAETRQLALAAGATLAFIALMIAFNISTREVEERVLLISE